MIAPESAPWRASEIARIMVGCALPPEMNSMNDRVFLDTNVLIYAHEPGTGIKHERARTLIENLWKTGDGVLSTQVMQELCVNLRHRTAKPWTVEETRNLIFDYMSWHIVVNTPDSITAALEIENRYQISFWDALIIYAAESSGVAILYSEDLSDGQLYGSVRVVNPFAEAATN